MSDGTESATSQVFQLVYTKVQNLEDSPRRKADYHTVFLPIALLNAQTALPQLEKMVRLSVGEGACEKAVVLYHKINHNWFLLLLLTQSLPEARDADGRTGFFLVHGFLFPPALWRRIPSPLACLSLVEEHRLCSREAVFAVPGINRHTGDIPPISVSCAKALAQPQPAPIADDFELRLALLLNHVARDKDNAPIVLIQAASARINELLSKLAAYVPADWRVNLGWDPAHDGQSLTGYPLPIAGFRTVRPSGRMDAITIVADNLEIRAASAQEALFQPENSYDRWVASARSAIAAEDVEKAYAWSLVLETETHPAPDQHWLQERGHSFIAANAEQIERTLDGRLGALSDSALYSRIVSPLCAAQRLALLGEGLPATTVARLVEHACLRDTWYPAPAQIAALARPLQAAGPCLRAMHCAWTGTAPDQSEIAGLPAEKLRELLGYFMSAPRGPASWLVAMLQARSDWFKALLEHEPSRRKAGALVAAVLVSRGAPSALADVMAGRALSDGKSADAFLGRLDLRGLLERAMPQVIRDRHLLRAALGWTEGTAVPRECVCLRAFAQPDSEAVRSAASNPEVRPVLLEHLLRSHRWNALALTVAGFSAAEVAAEAHRRGRYVPGLFLALLDAGNTQALRRAATVFRPDAEEASQLQARLQNSQIPSDAATHVSALLKSHGLRQWARRFLGRLGRR